MKTTWIGVGDTKILMGEITEDRETPEWHPIGQVTRRKIYDGVPWAWHAWQYLGHDKLCLGHFPDILDACRVVELAVR